MCAHRIPRYPAITLGILVAAVLIPTGFFVSVIGSNPTRPNGAIALLWAGAAALTIGLIGASVGLVVTGFES